MMQGKILSHVASFVGTICQDTRRKLFPTHYLNLKNARGNNQIRVQEKETERVRETKARNEAGKKKRIKNGFSAHSLMLSYPAFLYHLCTLCFC